MLPCVLRQHENAECSRSDECRIRNVSSTTVKSVMAAEWRGPGRNQEEIRKKAREDSVHHDEGAGKRTEKIL
jgi:hypothetical protein